MAGQEHGHLSGGDDSGRRSEEEASHPTSRHRWTKPDWVTAIATVMIFITTAAYTYYARKQWQEMESSGSDTHALAVSAGKQADAAKAQSEQAEEQTRKMAESLRKTDELVQQATRQARASSDLARAAKDQASAARTAAGTAEQSFRFTREVVERPNVLFEHLDPQDFPGKAPKFLLTFRNYGRISATNVVGNSTFGLRPGEIEDVFNLDAGGNFTLPPIPGNGIAQRWAALPDIPTERIHSIAAGTTRFYVFGFVRYTYLGKDFCAEYCLVYNPMHAIGPTGISLFEYCSKSEHNQEKPCPKQDQRPN